MLGMTWGDISPWIFYDMGLPLLLVAAAAYLLGCSNGAVIVSKYILRDDVRTHGSGNAGLTNFYRTFGGPLTLVVILCDVLKAVAAVWAGILMARYWDGGFWSQEAIVLVFAKYWAGLFCLLGHMFPCMFHFKGGKGILSGGTIAIMIDWRIALVVWGGFLILAILTRYVSWDRCGPEPAFRWPPGSSIRTGSSPCWACSWAAWWSTCTGATSTVC